MVEAAIASGPFLLLVFGILEFGLLFKDYLSLGYMTERGAREATIAANDAGADYFTLDGIEEAAAALPEAQINEILLWHASDEDDEAPVGACPSDVPGAECIRYTPADFSWAIEDFDCDPVTPGPDDSHWCPRDRKTFLAADADGQEGTDLIGVYISYTYHHFTGLFGDTVELTDHTIQRIEPQSVNDLSEAAP